MAAAGGTGNFFQRSQAFGGIDFFVADRAFHLICLALIIHHGIAAMRADQGGETVGFHVDGIATGTVDLVFRKNVGGCLHIPPAVWTLQSKFSHNNHHADRFALGTNRDERELTNGRLSCKIKFEEEAYYNAR